MRSLGDFYFWEPGNFWVVSDYQLARNLLRNPALSCDRSAFFISRMPNLDLSLIPDFFGVVKKMMVMSDGAEHARRRGVASKAFSEEVVMEYGRVAQAAVDRVLERWNPSEPMEFVSTVARWLPSTVLADLFSVSEEDRPDFFKWSIEMTQFFGGASQYRNEDGIRVNQAASSIVKYVAGRLREREKNPFHDFLSMLLDQNRQFGLSESELVAQSVMMLVAGQVTTTDQICNNLHTLLSHPELMEALRKNPAALPTAIEEFNRWDPGVTFIFRVVKTEMQVGEVTLSPGEVIFISTHAVNRDPLIFFEPERLNIHRSPNPHFAYGNGTHYCLGAPLARLQMQSLFSTLLTRFSALELDPKSSPERDHYSLAFSGFKSLSIINPQL